LQQLREIRDDTKTLRDIMCREPHRRFNDNGTERDKYEYKLLETSEKLQAHIYYPLLELFPQRLPDGLKNHWGVIVVRGDSFDRPVIIGRPLYPILRWKRGRLKVWTPSDGFDDKNIVVRQNKNDGRRMSATKRRRLDRGREWPSSRRQNTSGRSRESRDTTSPLSSVPSSPPYADPVSPPPQRRRTERSSRRQRRVSHVEGNPSPPPQPLNPSERQEIEIEDTTPTISDADLEKLVLCRFMGDGDGEPRERLLRDCKPLSNLFGHATVAGLVDSSPYNNVISASINGGPVIKLLKGDKKTGLR
jgi:hypothetical protein